MDLWGLRTFAEFAALPPLGSGGALRRGKEPCSSVWRGGNGAASYESAAKRFGLHEERELGKLRKICSRATLADPLQHATRQLCGCEPALVFPGDE